MSEWISVKDTLPMSCLSQDYMAYRPNAPVESKVSTLWYDPVHNGWSGKYKVTHWMPLPAPPKEE